MFLNRIFNRKGAPQLINSIIVLILFVTKYKDSYQQN